MSMSLPRLLNLRRVGSVRFQTKTQTTLRTARQTTWRSIMTMTPQQCKFATSQNVHSLLSYNRQTPLFFFFSSIRSFSSYPEHVVLPMPALSPTMEKGNISVWKVKVGDSVKPGQVMAEVETDKATVAFESVEEGFVAAILMPAGSTDVPVNTPVAIIVDDADKVAAFKNYAEGGATSASTPAAAEAAPSSSASSSTPASTSAPASASASNNGGRIFASPAARRISSEEGVPLSAVTGTGPNGRIVSADIKDQKSAILSAASSSSSIKSAPASSSAPAAPAAPASTPASSASVASSPLPALSEGDFTDLPLSNVRKVIAARLTQSKQTIPHYYVSVEVSMDRVLKLRGELNSLLGDSGTKLSVNDFIIKASALALRAVPTVNSSWNDKFVRQYNYVDISVAVATDGGLITPIVKDADTLGLATIGNTVKELAGRARQGKLQPHEYQGGTFTISNLGMFGVKHFTAIINPPQSAILAVGGTETRVVASTTKGADGQTQTFTTSQVMTVTLSSDHRVIDGAVAAQWLQSFKKFIEQPTSMLL